MRVITVIGTTLGAPKDYTSSATTWGQIKDTIARDFGNVNQMKAVCKENRSTLELDGAELPEGDITIFLSQKSIKAGVINIAETLDALKQEFLESIETAFDAVIERAEDGEFGDPEEVSQPINQSRISAQDKAFLEELAGI